ncbi:DUF4186 family protein [Streptomyces sp. NPDC058459]|uniref:DUF4186 family protein n=1 Tax=Streptomyces sp. NPDC058459 TaxID=3346508 RepID=UPI003660120A
MTRQPFRAGFRPHGRDRATADLEGPATVRRHAYDPIAGRLAPAQPYKDGKQTLYRGDPAFVAHLVFVAQHATGGR